MCGLHTQPMRLHFQADFFLIYFEKIWLQPLVTHKLYTCQVPPIQLTDKWLEVKGEPPYTFIGVNWECGGIWVYQNPIRETKPKNLLDKPGKNRKL